ncbi:MAG: DUF2341 domain-containing protein, partial [Candidatus Parvarchaeota archaeon]|nr:DUF2341 domain-containing protein [Candidatus Parvarchaeota archaeon]
QMINVTSSTPGWADISSSPFGQNVEFFSATGQILDSWLENYTSTHAIWWVKLTSSIPAGSKQTIYMGFAPASTSLFNTVNTGEAPQLSATYGQYDNGANVFNNYWNFAGTTLPSGWTAGSGVTVSADNGLTVTTGNNGYGYVYDTELSSPYIIEAYGEVTAYTSVAPAGGGYGIGTVTSTTSTWNYAVALWSVSGSPSEMAYQSSGSWTEVSDSWLENTFYTFNMQISSSGTIFQINYGNPFSESSASTPSSAYFMLSMGGTGVYQWARVRAYPPSGVMPSVTFGSVS